MRLPSPNARLQQIEDARQLHEDIYLAFLRPDLGRVFVEAGPDVDLEKRQVQLSGNLKRFWNDRGFRLFTKQSKDPYGIYLWIAKAPAEQQVA